MSKIDKKITLLYGIVVKASKPQSEERGSSPPSAPNYKFTVVRLYGLSRKSRLFSFTHTLYINSVATRMGLEINAFTIQSHQFWPIPDWDRNCKGVSKGQNYLLVPVFVRWDMLKGTDL